MKIRPIRILKGGSGFVKTKVRIGGRPLCVYEGNTTIRGVMRPDGGIDIFAGGIPFNRKKAAAKPKRSGLRQLAKATSPATSISHLLSLVNNTKDAKVAKAAIEDLEKRDLNEADLIVVASSPTWQTRLIAAKSPKTSNEVLFFRLKQDENVDVARAAIDNLKAKGMDEAKIMKNAASHPDFKIRLMMAEFPKTPINDLLKLVKDEDVAEEAMINLRARNVEEAVIMKNAASHPNSETRLIAAESTETPNDILLRLVEDENVDMARAAIDNLRTKKVKEAEIMKKAACSMNPEIRIIAAKSPETPNNVLLKFEKDKDRDIAGAAIENLNKKDLDEDELTVMASSPYWQIRLIAAKSPKTSNEVLFFRLIKDENVDVVKAAIENLKKRDLNEDDLSVAASSPAWQIRLIAAKSPKTPIISLLRLAKDEDKDVLEAVFDNLKAKNVDETQIMIFAASSLYSETRLIAAKSPKTPNDFLLRLVTDRNGDVAEAAKKTLSNTDELI